MSYFKAKIHQIRFRLGLCSRPLGWIEGGLLLREKGEGKGGGGGLREGEEREKGGEGKGKERRSGGEGVDIARPDL